MKVLIKGLCIFLIFVAILIAIFGDAIWPKLFRVIRGGEITHAGITVDLPKPWFYLEVKDDSILIVRPKDNTIHSNIGLNIRKNDHLPRKDINSVASDYCNMRDGTLFRLEGILLKSHAGFLCKKEPDFYYLFAWLYEQNILVNSNEVRAENRESLEKIFVKLLGNITFEHESEALK
ncbi:hypothetical protein [Geoalkalibacter ferrihydriticus]|uniref:hypothetical protein n=1 Tax=Geoalkalibacter ferrihydriticus TaxID=392333 RepID=UPI001113DCD6|nr:hypothetical protein [Geoalkalibacter ferrihydriticus]